MKVEGYCFFSKEHNDHLVVIISDQSPDGNALLVPLSSIKFNNEGAFEYNGKKCTRYDAACTLESNEIVSNNGLKVLNKPTYALYIMAMEISTTKIRSHMANNKFEVRCCVSDTVLRKLQDGARKSKDLKKRFQKYFEYFTTK